MFRILGIFFVLNSVVKTEICDFPAYDLPKKFDGGSISIGSTNKTYSVEPFSIEESDSKEFKKMYDILVKQNIVPVILGESKKEGKCNLYFTNVFNMDVKTYPNVASIKVTYDKMMKVLKDMKYEYEIVFSENAFRYNPSTDGYLFVDILELSKTKDKKKVELTDKNLNYAIIEWIFKYDIPVSSCDRIFLEKDDKRKLYYTEYEDRYDKKLDCPIYPIKDKISDPTYDKFPTNFEVELKTTDKSYKITTTIQESKTKKQDLHYAKLKDPKRSFTINGNETYLFMTVCHKVLPESNFRCAVLKEKKTQNILVWNNELVLDKSKNNRIDFEISEATTKIGERIIKLYKIYLLVCITTAPGVIPVDNILFELSKEQKEKNFYLMCETDGVNLRLIGDPKQRFKFKTEILPLIKLENATKKDIIQVNPSLFPEASKSCKGLSKKIYIIEKGKDDKKVITFRQEKRTDTYGEVIFSIFLDLVRKEKEVTDDAIQRCVKKPSYWRLFYILKPKQFNSEGRSADFYPEDVFLIQNRNEYREFTEMCLDNTNKDGQYSLNYDLEEIYAETKAEYRFSFNFNVFSAKNLKGLPDDKKNLVKNLVYLTRESEAKDLDFSYKVFEYPTLDPERFYLSFKQIGVDKYQVRAIFYSKKNGMREIETEKGGPLEPMGKPVKILDQTKSGLFSKKKPDPIEFETLSVSYLTSREIVYSVPIKNFSDCKPYLVSKKKKKTNEITIKIICAKMSLFSKAGKELKDSKNLSEGLEIIYSQLMELSKGKLKKDRLIIV